MWQRDASTPPECFDTECMFTFVTKRTSGGWLGYFSPHINDSVNIRFSNTVCAGAAEIAKRKTTTTTAIAVTTTMSTMMTMMEVMTMMEMEMFVQDQGKREGAGKLTANNSRAMVSGQM